MCERIWAILVGLLVLALATFALADVPTSMNVQGRMTDATGTPLPAGIKDLTFKIFATETLGTGTELWPGGAGETQAIETDDDGLWNAHVGSVIPLTQSVYADSVCWLEVTVDDRINPPEILPRIRMLTGPFAYRVATVDGASGGTIVSKVTIGSDNNNTGNHAFVAGRYNEVGGNYAVVSGGEGNAALSDHATVGGGYLDSALNIYATVSGGIQNTARAPRATVGGGQNNKAEAFYSTIGGGSANVVEGIHSTIPGGKGNTITANADYSLLIGLNSTLTQDSAFMVDMPHIIFGDQATGYEFPTTDGAVGQLLTTDGAGLLEWSDPVGGGSRWISSDSVLYTDHYVGLTRGNAFNALHGAGSHTMTNWGGMTCTTGTSEQDEWFPTVGGGLGNVAYGWSATVAGGTQNRATESYSFIGAGYQNSVSGWFSSIVGGDSNHVTGAHSAILGGIGDTITSRCSFLFGIRSKLTKDSTFMVDMPNIRFGDEVSGYEFPISDGTTGQILTTDGSGQLAWVKLPALDNGWTDLGSRVILSNNFDSVGLGTSSPTAKLHLTDSGSADCAMIVESQGTGSSVISQIQLATQEGGNGEITKYNTGRLAVGTGSASDLQLRTNGGGSVTVSIGSTDVINVESDFQVGIGTDAPSNRLDVAGNMAIGSGYSSWYTGPDDGLLVEGDVGLGTSTPQNKLDVEGGIAVGAGYSGDYAAPSNGLIVQGNVGIGLTNPNRKLYLAESVNGVSFPLKLDNHHSTFGVDATGILFSVGGEGGHQLATERGKGALVYEYTGTWNRGSFHFLQNDSTNASNPNLDAAVMTIQNNGNVGVGTISPDSKFEVEGVNPWVLVNTTGVGSEAGMRLREDGSNRWSIGWNSGNHYLYFYDHQSPGGTRMVIDDTQGYVGIGTGSPSERLHVSGNICYTGAIGACSDARYKTDVSPLSNSLSKVKQMQGVWYRWKQDEFPQQGFDDRLHLGFIAQDVEELFPEMVMTDKQGYKSVDYGRLTPVLVEAIKEQQNQLDEQQQQIDELRMLIEAQSAQR